MAINLSLAYLAAWVAAVAGFTIADVIEHPAVGPGILGNALYGLGWLLLAAPAVLFVLILLDLALYRVRHQRRVALAASLAPATMMAIVVFAVPPLFSMVAWLAATGLLFGLTMRLPPPNVGPSAAGSPASSATRPSCSPGQPSTPAG